jgi:hypothetical protein
MCSVLCFACEPWRCPPCSLRCHGHRERDALDDVRAASKQQVVAAKQQLAPARLPGCHRVALRASLLSPESTACPPRGPTARRARTRSTGSCRNPTTARRNNRGDLHRYICSRRSCRRFARGRSPWCRRTRGHARRRSHTKSSGSPDPTAEVRPPSPAPPALQRRARPHPKGSPRHRLAIRHRHSRRFPASARPRTNIRRAPQTLSRRRRGTL